MIALAFFLIGVAIIVTFVYLGWKAANKAAGEDDKKNGRRGD